jgi:hypothetical protein
MPMLFVLMGLLREDAGDRLPNAAEINEHLAQPFRHTRLAGYLRHEGGEASGLLMLVEADSFAEAEAHLHQSPFFKADLYERVEVAEYALEVGRLD